MAVFFYKILYDYYDVLSIFIDRKLLSRLKLNGFDECTLIETHDVVTLLYYLLSCNYFCMLIMLLAYRLRFACDVMSFQKSNKSILHCLIFRDTWTARY